MVVIILNVSIAMGAESHPQGGDGRGLFVRLELPWTSLLAGERLNYRFILENASDQSVPIAIPWAKDGFGFETGAQAFLEGKWRNGLPVTRSGDEPILKVEEALWPPMNSAGNAVEGWGELPVGLRIIWNQNQIWCDHYGIWANEMLEAVQAHWVVGGNRWISSNPVPVKVLNIARSEWSKVFDAQWSSYGLAKDSCSGTAYTIPIAGRLFLFLNDVRVAEVGQQDRFEHEIDKEGTNMEITIRNTTGSRKLYYHLRHGLTRDKPWTIGPVSLFHPKPESIPAGELAILRRIAEDEARSGGTGGGSTESVSGSFSGNGSSNDSPDGKSRWAWIGAGVMLIALGTFAFFISMRRKTNGFSS